MATKINPSVCDRGDDNAELITIRELMAMQIAAGLFSGGRTATEIIPRVAVRKANELIEELENFEDQRGKGRPG